MDDINLGMILGEIKNSQENLIKHFDTRFEELCVKTDNHEKRLTTIEINWKWVTGAAGLVGGLISLIITPIVNLFNK
jgi:hypothetical protein